MESLISPIQRQRVFKTWLTTTARAVAASAGMEYLHWRRLARQGDLQFFAVCRGRNGEEYHVAFSEKLELAIKRWAHWVATGAGEIPA